MKLNRYHIDVYIPPWGRESLLMFSFFLKEKKLEYSYHAKHKLNRMKKIYSEAVKCLVDSLDLSDDIYLDYVFEFYANERNQAKKVCYRFPMRDLDRDIILVVSDKGRIVTIYLNDNFDNHSALNTSLYEVKENENERPTTQKNG